MRSSFAALGSISGAVLAAMLIAAPARAGQYTVATCQADQVAFSTTAFRDIASRGMAISRACSPGGKGLRGLITSNALRAGGVPRGAAAITAMTAAAGTTFTRFRWAGAAIRSDCTYALTVYAVGPGGARVTLLDLPANQQCGQSSAGNAGSPRTVSTPGATRIVQSVTCAAPLRHECSTRGVNLIRTTQAAVEVADSQPPVSSITANTPLATGAWVSGVQLLRYSAQDNVGVRAAAAVIGGQIGGSQVRPCAMATNGAFSLPVPCPSGPGQIGVDTKTLPQGAQQLVVQARDAAGNVGSSAPVTARIDNRPPGRVDVAVDGGQDWRHRNTFALGWLNVPESDGAPIAAVTFKLCPLPPVVKCAQAQRKGQGIAIVPVQVPAAGQWTVSLWRQDAAGNQDANTASVPVRLRYDPEPPSLAFEAPAANDPTSVIVAAMDKVSGLAGGTIELSQLGSSIWQTLPTKLENGRLIAQIDDSTLAPGPYVMRATATDRAHNQASTTKRVDGQAMTLTLPLRIATTLQVGVPVTRDSRRPRKRGERARKVTVLKSEMDVRFDARVKISGQLTNHDGQGIPNAEIHVLSANGSDPAVLAGVVQTDEHGNYSYTAKGTENRVLRFTYAGTRSIMPAEDEVRLRVAATSTLRVSRAHVLNGQSVTFKGRLRTRPVPEGGKLIQLEVNLGGRWQTFRTARTDNTGRWAARYRFARTRGEQRYRFRITLPPESGYPFTAGSSRSVVVRVKGRS